MKSNKFNFYKIFNITLAGLMFVIGFVIYFYVTNGYCTDNCSYFVKNGVLSPLFVSSKWLTIILVVLALFPSHIFKKWLFFIAPPILGMTYLLVQNISVYSGNLLNPTRAQMAENGMVVLTAVTAIYVMYHYVHNWFKNKKSK